jgi:hypothetical protein
MLDEDPAVTTKELSDTTGASRTTISKYRKEREARLAAEQRRARFLHRAVTWVRAGLVRHSVRARLASPHGRRGTAPIAAGRAQTLTVLRSPVSRIVHMIRAPRKP